MCGKARSATQGVGARKLLRRRLEGFKAHVRRRATQDLGGRRECWEAERKWGLSRQLPEGSRAHVHTCGCFERGGQTAVRRFVRRPLGFGESCRRLLLVARRESTASCSCLMETGCRAPIRQEGMGAALAGGGVKSAPFVGDGEVAARPTGSLFSTGAALC